MDVKTTWIVVGIVMIICINVMYPLDFEDPLNIPKVSIPEYFEEESYITKRTQKNQSSSQKTPENTN